MATCQWKPGERCHFADDSVIKLLELDGRIVCLAHWPRFDADKSLDWISGYLHARQKRKSLNLSGFVIPNFGDQSISLNIGLLDLSGSTTLGNVELDCAHHGGKFVGSRFEGDVLFRRVGRSLDLSRAKFNGKLEIHTTSTADRLVLGGSELKQGFEIRAENGVDHFRSIDCKKAMFHKVPVFVPKDVPQDTTFYRAKFRDKATKFPSEPLHRDLRVAFSRNSAREMEGLFYTLEKRCHRRSLPWWPSGLARFVSLLYDGASNYGRRYELALSHLILLQVIFGTAYAAASDNFDIAWGVAAPVASFTFAQLFRPFDVFAPGTQASPAYVAVFGSDPSGWWLFWMSVHSLFSLSLFALFLIALRWRFRRE